MRTPAQPILIFLTLLFLNLATAAEPAPDEPESPYIWKPHTKSVAVFKNGFGFFTREAQVSLRDGWCVAEHVPPAAFGTLAIYAHNPAEAVDMVGSGPGEIVDFDGLDSPKDAAAKRARLEASLNLNVQIRFTQKGTKRTATGKLVSAAADFVVLEAENTNLAIPLDSIYQMQILNLPLRVHVSSDAGVPPKKTTLGMAYLSQGVTWIPEYTLRILDESNAELVLRGTFINEAEDLIHCDVSFVVGVPHFLHSDHLAPIAIGQIIRTLGAAVAPAGLQGQIMNRAAFANDIRAGQFERVTEAGVVDKPVQAGGRDAKSLLANIPMLEAAGASDFTVYTRKDLTVRRGEKAIVTLFTKKIKYSPLYRWELPHAIQHALLLQNDTDSAWTTGPCLAVSAGHPLNEDLLKYTPKGGKCEFPMTSAINLASEVLEKEIDRRLKAHVINNANLDLVTIQGELKIRNFEKRDVEIAIETPVPGKPLEATDEGELISDSTKLVLRERAGQIRWRVKVRPGESKSVTYKYERYVPSN